MSMAQFAPRRIIETPFQYPEGSYCVRVNGQPMEIIHNGFAPTSPPYYTGMGDGLERPRSRTPSDETDSPSPRLVRTYSYDRALFDFRRVPPEKIAAQMTLLDLPLFKAVTPQELREGGWNKKDKIKRAPNVVMFTRRFNHTSFLVMDEVLSEESPKVRAEIISQFIRVAKKLFELNNINSLKAVIAGLQSAPIYRLSQTWGCVSKKDMNSYSKMVEFLNEEDNWKRLRDHMDANRLPCIPYLGLFLTDLSFVYEVPGKRVQVDSICNTIAYFQNSTYDEFLPETHIQNFLSRQFFLDEFQRVFEDEKYRLSLKYEPSGQSTPTPPEKLRLSKSYEDLLGPFSTDHTHPRDDNPFASKPLTPVIATNGAFLMHRHSYHNIRERSHTAVVPLNLRQLGQQNSAHLPSGQAAKSPYKSATKSSKNATHLNVTRGASSVDSNFEGSPRPKKGSTLPKEFRTDPPSFGHASSSSSSGHGKRTQSESEEKARRMNPKSLVPWRRHRKAHSLGGNALATLGIQKHSPTHSSADSQTSATSLSRSLIDNDDTFSAGSSYTGSTGNLSNFSSCSCDSREVAMVNDEQGSNGGGEEDEDAYDVHEDHLAMAPILQGQLKKKQLKKAGKTVSQLRHRKRSCWVQLNEEYLLLLNCKPRLPGSSHWRSSKAPKVKGFISRLRDCRVKYKDPSEKMNDKQFILVDDEGSHIRFEAKTAGQAMEWVEAIRKAISDEKEKERRRVNQSLIQFNDP